MGAVINVSHGWRRRVGGIPFLRCEKSSLVTNPCFFRRTTTHSPLTTTDGANSPLAAVGAIAIKRVTVVLALLVVVHFVFIKQGDT